MSETIISAKYPTLRVWYEKESKFLGFEDGVFETDDVEVATFLKDRVATMEGNPAHARGKLAGKFKPMVSGPSSSAMAEEEDFIFDPNDVTKWTISVLKQNVSKVTEVESIQQAILVEENREEGNPRPSVINILKEREALLK